MDETPMDSEDVSHYPVVRLPTSGEVSLKSTVRFLVQQLVERGQVSPDHAARVECQVLHRESLGSTGVGQGIAIPHTKSEVVEEVVGLIGKSVSGIRWRGAVDERLVHTVCLLVTPSSKPRESIVALEAILAQLQREPKG